MYFIEDGNEENNTFVGNLGLTALQGQLLPSDSAPAIFWVTNPNNHFINNAGGGAAQGMWLAFGTRPFGSALGTNLDLQMLPLGIHFNNTMHSCTGSGYFADHGPDQNGNTGDGCWYFPRDVNYNESTYGKN